MTSIPLPERATGNSQSTSSEIEWLSASDKSLLACRVWRGRERQSVILYLHGIEGHSQWFEPTARVLQEQGLTIYAPDRRGSGLNSGARGDIPSLKIFIADVESLLRKIRLLHPTQSIFLYANCWSAKAASVIASSRHVYLDKQPPVELSGLVLTCPAIVTRADFNLITKLKIACCTFAPERFKKLSWPVPLTTEMLTDNSLYLDYLKADPLRLRTATARFFRETFILGLLAQRKASQLDLPVLVLQAANDQIVDINKLKSWFARVGSSDKQWRLFANATHSLDFDAVWFNEYTNIVSEWVTSRANEVTAPI